MSGRICFSEGFFVTGKIRDEDVVLEYVVKESFEVSKMGR